MELIKMLGAVILLWAAMFALLYGILERSAFWISIAIYCKISSSLAAYELGWLKPKESSK